MADFAAKNTYTMRQVNPWLKIKGSEAATACYLSVLHMVYVIVNCSDHAGSAG
jgi:hypothetical protein